MMIFQSAAVTEILLGRDAGWRAQRRGDRGVARQEIYRKLAVPTLCGIAMAASAYAISVPLLLWMSPVIVGLVLATPIGIVTSMPTRLGWMFATPEDNIPPTVLLRASELAASAPVAMAGALADLRENPELLRRHLKALVPRPRKSGTIDVDLAVARARMEKSDTF